MATEGALIKVTVKSPTVRHEVEIAPGATVSDLKDKILLLVPTANKEQICIIYTGKILKDEETLAQNKISDGHTVHLVVRNQNRPPAASVAPTPQATATPPTSTASSGAPPASGNPFAGFGSLGGASPADILNNPEAMRNVMDNPITQQLLSNPEFMRTIIQSNPQFQALIERNPEVGHILNDPNVMRQTMEMIRNPNMFQEMMRNHDQAIRNLQGIPGGEAALERLYNDVQEPLLNSASNSLGGNPFASLRSDQAAEPRVDRAGQENNEALPNPWASNANQANNPSNNRSADFNYSAMMDSPGLGSLMEQMMSNPSIQASMFSPEVINSIRQSVSSNPGLMDSILGSLPNARENPELAEGIRRNFPQMLNMMSDPSVLEAVRNPRVSEAFRQIQEGFNTLRREAPQLLNMFTPGAAGMESMFGGAAAAGGAAGGAGSPGAGAGAGGMAGMAGMGGLADLMSRMNFGAAAGATGGAPAAPSVNPEQTYASQLEQLQSMGFSDRARNIAALTAAFGDLNAAVERLLNSP